MPRRSAMLGTLALERRRAAPLHRQVYDALRTAVLDGRLPAGSRLPSTRALARDLGAARNTVMTAFEQLVAEGYLEARVGDGTRVAAVPPEALLEARRSRAAAALPGPVPGLSSRGRAMMTARRPVVEPGRRAFHPGVPALDAFPTEIWARLLARRARLPPRGSLGYAHPAGLPILRAAIATYLGPARGVTCAPEQVIVVPGAQAGLALTCALLLDAGEPAWIEEPGYLGARGAMVAAGARLVPVPVDADGLDLAEGERRCPDARLVHVTPSCQFPLGVTMPLARRLALLEWAARAGSWIVEDDFDSEYRYAGRPIAAMQGLDAAGRVVYLGSFSKTMFPALRVGYLVVPPTLADAFGAAVRLTGHVVSTTLQAALADFLDEGHFAAHVRRMRGLYAARQARLVSAARRHLTGLLDVRPADAGMQIAAPLPAGVDDAAAAAAADAVGLVTPPLSLYQLERPLRHRGLYLGYACVPEREIEPAVERLAHALEPLVQRRRGGAAPAPVLPTRRARR